MKIYRRICLPCRCHARAGERARQAKWRRVRERAEMKDKVRATTTNKLGKLSSSNRQQPVRQPTSVSLQSPLWVMRQSRVRLRLPISPSSSPHHSARARARPSCPPLFPLSLFPAALIGKGYGPARSLHHDRIRHSPDLSERQAHLHPAGEQESSPWSISRAINREYEALLNDPDEAAGAL